MTDVKIRDLKPGDMVDMENDPYADENDPGKPILK